MNNFFKIIIINNIGLLIILGLMGYFFWSWRRVTPILVPAGNINQKITQEKFLSFLTNVQISDPKTGNGGDVEISLEKKDGSIEISWPQEFEFYSLLLKNLGKTDKTDDNKVLLGFTADVPQQNRYFPKAGPVVIERIKIDPPLSISSEFASAGELAKKVSPLPIPTSPLEFIKGEKYSIEIIFEKQGEDKIYTGIYGFTY